MSALLQRLRDKRDLCASEHASDIANLLHEAVLHITALQQRADDGDRCRDALRDLVDAYRAMPDGELGRGLSNGLFLRAEALLQPLPAVVGSDSPNGPVNLTTRAANELGS
jgi:hypothetical protein